jgi:hypothetical protein
MNIVYEFHLNKVIFYVMSCPVISNHTISYHLSYHITSQHIIYIILYYKDMQSLTVHL